MCVNKQKPGMNSSKDSGSSDAIVRHYNEPGLLSSHGL